MPPPRGPAPRIVALLAVLATIVLLTVPAAVATTMRPAARPSPEDAEDLLREGLDAHVAGDLETAEDLYLQVVDADPDNRLG